nr:MAG TPA: hypothetical protein [Caudoviricetes sp.]
MVASARCVWCVIKKTWQCASRLSNTILTRIGKREIHSKL